MKSTIMVPVFEPGQSTKQVHSALCLAVQTLDKVEQCAVLWFGEIWQRKLYKKLGYSSIYQYASQELNFSDTRTGDFVRLAKKLEELPIVRQSVATGKLGYTKAREVIKVATAETEAEWVQEAIAKPRSELTRQVSLARRKAIGQRKADPNQGLLLPDKEVGPRVVIPVRVSIEMTPEQFARYEALWEKLHKLGGLPANKSDVLLAALGALADAEVKSTPRGADSRHHTQINVHQCPSCNRATIQTNRGEMELSGPELERLQCDATIAQNNQPNRSTIAPSIRKQVLLRDRYVCQAPGCKSSHFLEVHHIKARQFGGGNDPGNLVTLCSGCHRVYHRQKGGVFEFLGYGK